jgi:D-arabinose 1-dehydrogenase-like Zn-dependent alcohol dehydrogenase
MGHPTSRRVHCRRKKREINRPQDWSGVSVPAFGLITARKSVAGSPTGSPTVIDQMLAFSARHSIVPLTETFPMSQVNDALEHLRAGKARYRVVLVNDHS